MVTQRTEKRLKKKYDTLFEKEDTRHEKAYERIYDQRGRELTRLIKKKKVGR